jgi:hypothetical protein
MHGDRERGVSIVNSAQDLHTSPHANTPVATDTPGMVDMASHTPADISLLQLRSRTTRNPGSSDRVAQMNKTSGEVATARRDTRLGTVPCAGQTRSCGSHPVP